MKRPFRCRRQRRPPVDDEDEDRRGRRQGPRLPPRRRPAGDLPRLQGLQHPARLGKRSALFFHRTSSLVVLDFAPFKKKKVLDFASSSSGNGSYQQTGQADTRHSGDRKILVP